MRRHPLGAVALRARKDEEVGHVVGDVLNVRFEYDESVAFSRGATRHGCRVTCPAHDEVTRGAGRVVSRCGRDRWMGGEELAALCKG